MSGSSTDASPPGGVDYIAVEQSASFVELKRRHRSFVWPLTIAFLVWYFAYVLLSTYATGFMGTPAIGNVTIGMLMGLLQFVTTFAITWLYLRQARRRLDPIAQQIREQLEGGAR